MPTPSLALPATVSYKEAVDIYESVARDSLASNLLKYSVKNYLLNAGICQLCRSDQVAIQNALERYQVRREGGALEDEGGGGEAGRSD